MPFEIKNGLLQRYIPENGITDITIPDSVTRIGYHAFFDCTFGLKSVIIPDSVEGIESYAFACCQELKEITIPDSVRIIGTYAFQYSALEVFSISESIETIYFEALDGCMDLKTVNLSIDGKTVVIHDNGGICNKNGKLKEDAKRMFDFLKAEFSEREAILGKMKKAEYKVPLAFHLYFEHGSVTAEEYLKKDIRKIMKYLTEKGDIETISKLLPKGFVKKNHIDEIISYAFEANNTEICDMLVKFREENFGTGELTKPFKL